MTCSSGCGGGLNQIRLRSNFMLRGTSEQRVTHDNLWGKVSCVSKFRSISEERLSRRVYTENHVRGQ